MKKMYYAKVSRTNVVKTNLSNFVFLRRSFKKLNLVQVLAYRGNLWSINNIVQALVNVCGRQAVMRGIVALQRGNEWSQ
jgi:hypothetical protein